MIRNKDNLELYITLPELYKDLPNDYIYQLVKIIFEKSNRVEQIDAFYSVREASKMISNMDVWFSLRSVYKHFCSIEINFQYKKHFRFTEIFQKENIIMHLHKMYENLTLQKITWKNLAEDDDLFSYYLAYIEAFIRSLYDSDFGYDYERFFISTSDYLNQIYNDNTSITHTFLLPQIPLKDMN